ncbi:MAG TPA: hypothetical protein VM639_07390 [Dongiaceae bacterium]|nr:hypothetical protein [Dongiaceae bacterium]
MGDPVSAPALTRQQAITAILQHVHAAPLDERRLNEILQFYRAHSHQLSGPAGAISAADRQRTFRRLSGDKTGQRIPATKLALFILDSCAHGEDDALRLAVSDLMSAEMGGARFAPALRDLLNQAGLGTTPRQQTLDGIKDRLCEMAQTIDQFIGGCTLAGLSAGAPQATRASVFQRLALPIMQRLAIGSGTDAMLMLERMIYNQYIKIQEEPEHHKQAFAAIEPIMKEVARHQGRRDRPTLPARSAARPKVAFILHNGYRLAHVEVLLSVLNGMAQLRDNPIEPSVYLLWNAGHDELKAACQPLNVAVYADAGPQEDVGIVSHFDRCRTFLAEHGVSAAVFVSVPMHLAYLSEAPLAPVQIWWSMKFALPNFPGLDGRVYNLSLLDRTFEVDGAVWHGGPPGLLPPPPVAEDVVAGIRAKYPYRKILGTIAREEKIREPSFLAAIVRVLQRYPDVCFLWTGRNRLPEIDAAFRAGGVADRCYFVGWIDAAVYCRVYDIFVEPYPVTGLMVTWAMHMKTPVASIGRLGILGAYLHGVFDGSAPLTASERDDLYQIFGGVLQRLPALSADTPADIDPIINRLIEDDVLAAELAEAQQSFVRRYLSDPVKFARRQAERFAEIIEEKSRGADMPGKPEAASATGEG